MNKLVVTLTNAYMFSSDQSTKIKSYVTTNKPTPSFIQAGCPSCRPTNSVRALKGEIEQHCTIKLHLHC